MRKRNLQPSFRCCLGLRGDTITGRLRLGRFRAKGPGRVALRPIGAGELALPCQLLDTLLRVLRARQRCQESDNVVDLGLAQSKWLDVSVEIGIMYPVTLVVMVHHIPQRLLRAVVKVRRRNEYVAQVWCLEGRDVGVFLGDEKAAEC